MVILYQILYKGFNIFSNHLFTLAVDNHLVRRLGEFGRFEYYFNVIGCKSRKGNLYLLINDNV
jgi:hypothetical protein